ncbi:MAG: glutamate--tRNA ligase [Acidimicrobiaceae bacterium]|nr:glutamate--tRNA ligase [Acidimicrobiaceae bacterium]
MSPPRVRLAPSPTGYFHVGTGRQALHNWLFARQHGGTFVLRVEDTDTARNRAEYTDGILGALRWLGLEWDEGPYFQSERGKLYRGAIDELLGAGKVYACDCTAAAVAERARQRGGPPGYDGYCRDRGLEPAPGRLLRFRTPDEGQTAFDDVIRGRVSVDNARIEDFGVRKSNGDPLFILANVVDDADMRITHVIRGDDHIPNTPKYILLWEALGYGDLPVFAHTPMLLNASRQKLSKRRSTDKVAVEDYRDEGYLPEAFRNYLALLGWAPSGGREILTLDEMVAEFRLEDVKSAGAIFDERKLAAVNADYIRALPPEEFVARSQAWLLGRWAPIAPLVQERVQTLGEVYTTVDFLSRTEPVLDTEAWDREVAKQPAFGAMLEAAASAYADESLEWTADAIKDATVAAGESVGLGSLRKAQGPVRLAVTGRTVGPPLFESLALLGRDHTLARLAAGRARLD